MSYMDNFWKELEELEKKKKKIDNITVTSPYSGGSSTVNRNTYTGGNLSSTVSTDDDDSSSGDYMSKFWEELERLDEEAKKREASIRAEEFFSRKEYGSTREEAMQEAAKMAKDSLVPAKEEKEEKKKWFDKGGFGEFDEDDNLLDKIYKGYKAVLATGADIGENVNTAVVDATENLIDGGAFLVGTVGGFFDKEWRDEKVRPFIAKDLLKPKETGEYLYRYTSGDFLTPLLVGDSEDIEQYSVLGDKVDSTVQSLSHNVGVKALARIGVPWQAPVAANAFGSTIEEAYRNGASWWEGAATGAASVGIELGTEALFGGSGLGETGLFNLDSLTSSIKNRIIKRLADIGVDIVAEGIEEEVAEVANNAASKIYRDESWKEVMWGEEAREGYIDALIASSISTGALNVGKISNSFSNNTDYRTGLTENEQKVFDKRYNDLIAEAEKNGKVTNRVKDKIYDTVMNEIEKGYISTDTIEEIVGGETYKQYQGAVESEKAKQTEYDAWQTEYDELYNTPRGEMTGKQIDREQELGNLLKNKPTTAESEKLRTQLESRVKGILRGDRKGNGSLLLESYNEKARREQYFEADVSQYKNEAARKTVQNLLDINYANNTNRTKELANTLAKMSERSGRVYNFTNTEKLKESGAYISQKEFTADGTTTEFDLGVTKIDDDYTPVVKIGDTVIENLTVDYENGKIIFKEAPTAIDGQNTITVEYRKTDLVNGIRTKDEIIVNLDSKRAWSFIVGHEVTHDWEHTSDYKELQEVLFSIAEKKGELQARRDSLSKHYNKGTDIDSEVTADLVGEYLFSDSDFFDILATEHRNVFQRVYDAIKRMLKIVTAGSKEARDLERAKYLAEKAWRESNQARLNNTVLEGKDDIQYSLRTEAPPTKTEKAYKLMRLVDGKLYPLFIGNNEAVEVGTWYNADSPNLSQLQNLEPGTHLVDMQTGEAITWDEYAEQYLPKKNGKPVRNKPNKDDIHWANENGYRFMYIEDKAGGKSESRMLKQYGDTRAYYNWGVNGSSKSKSGEGSASLYALRPGWHFGEVPSMRQIGYGGEDGETVRLDNQVWVEVEMSADVDYNAEAESNWGGDIPTHIPTDGYYKFATNPTQKKTKKGNTANDATKADWYVAGAFKVNRILSDAEADSIVDNYNKTNGRNVPLDYRRNNGRVFNAETMQVEDPVQYSLSAEQEEYFKDSVVRDENGNLKVMYHGTANGGHTVFDTYGSKYGLFGTGSYFTDNKSVAEKYTDKFNERGNDNKQVYEAFLNITNPMDMDAQANPQEWAKAFPDASFPESGTNEEFYRAMEEYFYDEMYSKGEAAEIAMDALMGMGYDGITHIGGGRVNRNGVRHQVYIAFHPEQIKNTDNFKPTSDPDIRYSLSTDSEGNQLSKGQQEYFKDTKALDVNGNLLKVYHTTNNDFTVFDKSKKGETTGDYNTFLGFFFADNPEYMAQFPEFENGKTQAYYLNMKNPIDMNNISKQAFLDIVEVTGGDVQEAAEIYDQYYAEELKRAEFRGDNSTIMEMARLLEEMTGEYFDYAEFYKALKPNYEQLISKGYDGFINGLDGMGWANEYIVLDSNQAKLTTNTNPTLDEDVRYSLSDADVDYSRIQEMQMEVNRLNESIKVLEASDGYKDQMDKILKAIGTEDTNAVIEGYNRWIKESGYEELLDKRNALRDELVELRKRAEEIRHNQELEAERKAIEKSGLSEADYFRKQAVKEFGYTPFFYDAGYITTNGKMLNFSGEKGHHFGTRGQDHRAIGIIYEGTSGTDALTRFLNDGNIRIIAESPGIDLSATVEPTKEQYATIKKFVYEYADKQYFAVDLSDKDGRVVGSLQYENRIYPTRIISDIQHYYATGEIRQPSVLDGFSYSLSEDSKGRQISTAVQIRFSNSKVVDEDGKLKPVFHGTATGEFAIFDKSKGSVEGDFGSGFYFTDNEADVSEHYEGGGPDFDNKVARLAEQIEAEEEIDYDEAEARAREELYKGSHKFEVYLNIENPAIVGETTLLDSESYYEQFNEDDYDDYDDYLADMEQLVADDIENIVWDVESNVDVYSTEGLSGVLWEAYAEGGIGIEELKNKINELYLEDSNGNLVGNEVTRQIIESLGYDGIIDPTVSTKWNMDIEPGTKHYIVFKPNQIKSVTNQNPTDDPNIHRSLSDDGIFPIASDRYNVPAQELRYEDGLAPVAETATQESVADNTQVAEAVRADNVTYAVNELLSAKLQNFETELANNRKLREESLEGYNADIAELQAKYDSKKNKNTKTANGILRSIERLKRLRDNADLDYAKRIGNLEERIAKMNTPEYKTAVHRQAKMAQHTEFWQNILGDTSTWKDLPLGLSYKTKTLRRILRKVVRDAEGKPDIAKADAIYDALETKYDHNEALLKRESVRLKEVFQKLNLNHTEDTYAHMLGELRHNPDTTLTEDVVNEYYEKHKKKINTDRVDKAIDEARKVFDELIGRLNTVLREQGFKEIPYRQGYFPHFTNPKQGILGKILNWKTIDNEIPTSIAGLTDTFKPQRSYQTFNKERKGDTTDYSLYQGLDTYIHGALDWIYHIDDLQSRRALENHIRYIHSEEGIKSRIEEIKSNETYDADQAQAMIDAVLKEAGNPLSGLVRELMNRTNTLANKKSSMDRGMEDFTNRKIYSTMTNLNNRINANMVVGSFSSALTNFIPMVQSWHQVSPYYTVRGLGDYIRSVIHDDGMVAKSDYLTNRLVEEEKLYKTGWDKVTDKAALMMNVIDGITSQTVWRSKYLQNIKEGMSESQAIKDADQFAKNVMAGRSRGNAPTIFDAKNPLVKIATAFQLEVANQYGYMFSDVRHDSKNKARLVKGYATAFLGAYLYNSLYSSLVGRNAAFDPISIIEDLFRDLGWFGDDEEEEPEDIVLNLADNILEEVPFVGSFVGGGRIPISSALPYEGDYKSFVSDAFNDEIKVKEMLKPLYYLALPVAGGQIKKSVEGLSMFDKDNPVPGSYTDSGNLRFPVDDTFGNKVQAALFGQWANENARDYFDNERKPLNEKQTQEFIDLDIPIGDYWEYREGLSGLKTNEEKFDYIDSLDLPVAKKNILINNIVDRKDPVDMQDYGEYSTYEEYDYAIKYPEKYDFLQENNISYAEYMSYNEDAKEEIDSVYSWVTNYPDKVVVAKAVTDSVIEYRQYSSALDDIRADKDAYGKTISGSAKQKKFDYINGLDIDYGAKLILFKNEYKADDTYNYEIIDYLNNRADISYEDMITILKELGFTIEPDGVTITWD